MTVEQYLLKQIEQLEKENAKLQDENANLKKILCAIVKTPEIGVKLKEMISKASDQICKSLR